MTEMDSRLAFVATGLLVSSSAGIALIDLGDNQCDQIRGLVANLISANIIDQCYNHKDGGSWSMTQFVMNIDFCV